MSGNLAEKLRTLIQDQNMSVKGVEKQAGLGINAVRSILTGHSKKPSAEHLLAIAKVLGCTIGELLDEDIPEKYALKKENILQEFVFKDMSLLEKTLSYIGTFHKKNPEKNSTNKKIIDAIQNIYVYSIDNNGGVFDERFAKWFLNRDTRM